MGAASPFWGGKEGACADGNLPFSKRIVMKPPLSLGKILAWADAHHRRSGRWPTNGSPAPLPEAPDENWRGIDWALRRGARGLPGGSSLAQLLAKHRNRRNLAAMPPLSMPQVLAWADAYHHRKGQWPNKDSGPVAEAPVENWNTINAALRIGRRGLPGGTTLAKLLAQCRGYQPAHKDRLSTRQILAWANAHCLRTGAWPKLDSGPLPDAPRETWLKVDRALRHGLRGLRSHQSLARFLEKHCDKCLNTTLPRLSIAQILDWADRHHRRTGRWPSRASGRVTEAPAEHWGTINSLLRKGGRGLPGGLTLTRLLAEHRGRRPRGKTPLTVGQILDWAELHRRRTGRWPTLASGRVGDAPGETWRAIDVALLRGLRGLQGHISLARLLEKHRGKPYYGLPPPLSIGQILTWADAHHRRTGRCPRANSGAVEGDQGERWSAIDTALRKGGRGLPGGSSLSRLLREPCEEPAAKPAEKAETDC